MRGKCMDSFVKRGVWAFGLGGMSREDIRYLVLGMAWMESFMYGLLACCSYWIDIPPRQTSRFEITMVLSVVHVMHRLVVPFKSPPPLFSAIVHALNPSGEHAMLCFLRPVA